mmetsp:Transcript_9503/g.30368  ORF Transcript_9503/g.30368 Transcript_9503/m.30368 type:complete len:440 (+) Transcript_9503:70-1389(+)
MPRNGASVEEVVPKRYERGETRRAVRHALRDKARKIDTSVDQEWQVDSSLCVNDAYVLLMCGVWLLLKTVLLVVPLLLTALPPALASRIYAACVATPSERVTGRRRLVLLVLPLALPLLLIMLISLVLDFIAYYLISVPFFVCRCVCCPCRVKLCASYAALAPYRGGPYVLWYLPDIFVALVGQTARQGVVESCGKLAFMSIYQPTIKYTISANPLIYNLEERFVQQISTTLNDVPLDQICATTKRIISRTKQERDLRDTQDGWRFAPHYPYPPDGREWALGLQAGGSSWYGSFLVTHTTHFPPDFADKFAAHPLVVRSNSAALPIYRVMLWYNNPYHFFTGWVEASVSNGQKSQLDKFHGGEHPMWLVTSRSPLLSRRTSWFGPGMIDRFFDYWLPFFVFEVRRLTRGEKAAVDLKEEVISKDGISRPAGRAAKQLEV